MRDLMSWWSSPQWRAEVEPWIHDRLGDVGLMATGPIEQFRVRFWSTLLTIPTSVGRVWFKENSPAQAFEAALTARISVIAPGRVLTPLAVEPDRGWMLVPDGGAILRERGAVGVAEWERVLTEFGELQLALVDHEVDLLATGLSAMPSQHALEYVDRVLGDAGSDAAEHAHPHDGDSASGQPTGDRPSDDQPGRRFVGEAGAILAGSGIPNSLQHNDLHDGNAFVPDHGQLTFFDLGDAVWAHPFCAVAIPLWVMRDQGLTSKGDAAERRLLDAYLGVWSAYGDRASLRALIPAAERLAGLHRSESWRRLLSEVLPGTFPDEWRGADRWGLDAALDPEPR